MFLKGLDTCEQGLYGEQCEYHCHCAQGGGCDKVTGECNNRLCAEGWAGSDCQQGNVVE